MKIFLVIVTKISLTVNSLGNPCSQYWRRKEDYDGEDLQKKKVLSLEWKWGVMEN